MPEPGRRIVIKTVPEDVSRHWLSQTWLGHPTLTLTVSIIEVVDPFNAS